MIIKELFKIDKDFFILETYQETKTKPEKVFEKIEIFDEKTFLEQQVTGDGFILLKPIELYINIGMRICNYTNNYTAMTVTMSYYYSTNNYILISK